MGRGFQRRISFIRMRKRPVRAYAPIRLIVWLLLIGLLGALIYYETTMRPILEQYAESEVRNHVQLLMNRMVEKEIANEKITYASLISIEKGSDGHILSLTTDVGAMNTLKTRVESAIVQKILDSQSFRVSVPIGSLFGNEFLSGRGPRIHVKVVPIAEVFASYDNTFASAGINQTRHQVYLKYDVKMRLFLPGKQKGTTVTSSVCVAETIIVGATPQFFAGVQK